MTNVRPHQEVEEKREKEKEMKGGKEGSRGKKPKFCFSLFPVSLTSPSAMVLHGNASLGLPIILTRQEETKAMP